MGAEFWLWLAEGLGYGAVNSGELLGAYPGGAVQVAEELGSEKMDEILTQKQAERLAASRPMDFSLRLAHAAAEGIEALGFDDDNYPDLLRGIHNPPPVLFVKGDATLLNGQLAIGIVGARRPSAYGVEAVKAIGRGVALGGAIIVSGLAAGLDSEAHKAALAVNGPTIACIAFGHDTCYPASNKKLMEVIERYGAVVSEYPLGTTAEKPFFLQRNRLIAGISHGLVVAEARRHSGTMSTVNFATDYGRDVFGVPGSIFSDLSGGTNAMIREGAYLAGSASDILAVYGIELEEDPMDAAAKQAQEGRPEAAVATPPPWQQNLARQTARRKEERVREQEEPDEKPWAKTLAEALQSELASEDTQQGRVSSKAAVEAFRKLQSSLPATDDSEIDARNRALDEMVAAVSDTVELGERNQPKAPAQRSEPAQKENNGRNGKKENGGQRISPFPWNRVEHLSKDEMSQLGKGAPAQSAPSNTGAKPAATPVASGSLAPVGRVERVGRVEAVSRMEPVAPAGPAAAVAPMGAGGGAQAPGAQRPAAAPMPSGRVSPAGAGGDGFAPSVRLPEAPGTQVGDAFSPSRDAAAPVAQREETPAAGMPANGADGTSDRLRTLGKPEPSPSVAEQPAVEKNDLRTGVSAAQAAPATQDAAKIAFAETQRQVDAGLQQDLVGVLDMDDEEAAAPDPMGLLSDDAKKAFGVLGAAPVSLNQICDESGLSPGAARAALTELELAGLSRQLAGRQFVIMQ